MGGRGLLHVDGRGLFSKVSRVRFKMATVRKDSSPPLERSQVKTEGVKKEKIEGDKKFPVKRLKNSKKTRPER